jgi:hypothetical protein
MKDMRTLFLFAITGVAAVAQTWVTMGAGGSARTADDGTLEFKYELGTKQFAAAVLPSDGSVASMKSLRFRAKSDHDTTLGVLLGERKPGGGNYVALFWSPANQWQQIELTPRDFDLSDGPTDPVDADGKLDLDQVEGIAIFDLAHFFEGAMDREKIVVTKSTGAHTILIDNFEVRASAPARSENTIDAFDRGFLQWMTPGGMTLMWVPETGPLGEPSLKATYQETTEPYAFLMRRVASLNLAKAKHLTFDIASENETTLLIALEMKQEARYHLTIYPPAGRKIFHVDLSLDDFERESGTGPEKFDPSRWKSIAITDISGGNSANAFWLGNVRVKDE